MNNSGTEHQIAFGVAIGLVVGFTPTMGFQMVMAAFIATLLRANRVTAIISLWITNPLTAVPIYGFCYWVGYWICYLFGLNSPTVGEFVDAMKELINRTDGTSFWDLSSFWQSFKEFLKKAWEMQPALWTGCFLIGFITAIPSYFLTVYGVKRFRNLKEKKRLAREKRIQKQE